MPRPLKIDHLTILWRDTAASEPYYAALLPLLGFSQTKRGIWTDGEGFFLQFRPANPETREYERYGPGVNHVGFGAPDPETVERVQTQMRAVGFDAPEIRDLNGARALFMKDPDGLRFEITWYPPGVPVVD
ncbi:VOC family protein [Brevundimonas sp. 2R-24]|uniref:VOC family protein n=1 Tax=Peiella sedimenti TaxID=3061083 RepID=A0ABT8SN18_9CAUL|nr:VOC family protein [Caulobacteraceae bacterium XZ-24]